MNWNKSESMMVPVEKSRIHQSPEDFSSGSYKYIHEMILAIHQQAVGIL